jgi:hypothetical protein
MIEIQVTETGEAWWDAATAGMPPIDGHVPQAVDSITMAPKRWGSGFKGWGETPFNFWRL